MRSAYPPSTYWSRYDGPKRPMASCRCLLLSRVAHCQWNTGSMRPQYPQGLCDSSEPSIRQAACHRFREFRLRNETAFSDLFEVIGMVPLSIANLSDLPAWLFQGFHLYLPVGQSLKS
jgi:hypothetical protein